MPGDGGLDFTIGIEDLGAERPAAVATPGPASGPTAPPPAPPPVVGLSAAELALLKKQFGDALTQSILQRGEIGGVPLPQALAPTPAPFGPSSSPAGEAVSLAPGEAESLRPRPADEEMARLLGPEPAGQHALEEILLPAEVEAAPKLAAQMRTMAAEPVPALTTPESEAAARRHDQDEGPLPLVEILGELDQCVSDKLVPAVGRLAGTLEDSARVHERAAGARPATTTEIREIREVHTAEEARAEPVASEPPPEVIDLVLPARTLAEMTEAVAAGLVHGFAEVGASGPAAEAAAATPTLEEEIRAAARQHGLPTETYGLAAEAVPAVETIPLEPATGPRTYGLAPEARETPTETIPLHHEAHEAPLLEQGMPEVFGLQPTERVEEERVPLSAEARPDVYPVELLPEELAEEEPVDSLEVLDDDDPRAHAARRQAAEVDAAQNKAAYENLSGPAEVLDPNEEARRQHLKDMNETLQGGSRIAAQGGGVGGDVGEGLLGVADLAMGIGTGDPIQAAIGAFQLLDVGVDMTAGAFNAATDMINSYVDYLGDVIDNDYVGAFENRLDEVGQVLGKIPIAGEAVAAGFNLLAAPVQGFLHLTEDLLARGQQLSQFSGPLAQANALAEVRATLADLHEADVLGPDLARLTDSFSEAMNELREMVLPFKEFLVEKMADGMEWLLEKIQAMHVLLVQIEAAMQDVPRMFEALKPIGGPKMAEVIKEMKGHMKDAADALEAQRQHSAEELHHLDRNTFRQLPPLFGSKGPVADPRRGMWAPTVGI